MPPSIAERPARLAADDWLEAALATLVSGGIEAVQITVLARDLGVTRGSFYWHFESREALLDALLTEWRARNTGVMVEALEGTTTLDDGILALFSVWVDHRRFDPRLDQAVRDWARHSEQLRGVVKAEDAAEYILGYTCGNDVSERNWQHGSQGDKKDVQWWRAKGSGPARARDSPSRSPSTRS